MLQQHSSAPRAALSDTAVCRPFRAFRFLLAEGRWLPPPPSPHHSRAYRDRLHGELDSRLLVHDRPHNPLNPLPEHVAIDVIELPDVTEDASQSNRRNRNPGIGMGVGTSFTRKHPVAFCHILSAPCGTNSTPLLRHARL